MNTTYAITPQIIIDLRYTMPAVRDQGQKSLCLPFAVSDSNSQHQKIHQHLSVEYLAYHACVIQGVPNYTRGLSPNSVFESLRTHGQPHESQWPYMSGSSLVKPPLGLQPLYIAGSKPGASTLLEIKDSLAIGLPVVACFEITSQFSNLTSPFIIHDVGSTQGRHAVVVVGLGQHAGGEPFLLIRNSWGDTWGDGGHAWITEEFFTKKLMSAYVLN